MVLIAPSVGRSYVSSPVAGLVRAVKRLGIKGLALTPPVREGFAPSFTTLAREGFDLVVGIGFEEVPDILRVARMFPRTRFAIVDVSVHQLGPYGTRAPKNLLGLVFREQQVGYLAGYLAGLMEDLRHGRHVVSTVGGYPVPPVQRYIAGFQAGARKVDPRIRLINNYSKDFDNPDACRGLANAQIAQGSGVVFQVAGGCGLGALEAARAAPHVFGVGVDIDQSYLGPAILTSALKRWSRAVFQTIQRLRQGTLPRSGDLVFGYRSGDMGLGRISRLVSRSFVKRIEALERAMAKGRIRGIPASPIVP